jgi:hypothetical protein
VIFSDGLIRDAQPYKELKAAVMIPETVGARHWSGAGLRAFLEGKRPVPCEVFDRLATAIDYFMEFSTDSDEQRLMVEAITAYTMSTYFHDEFPVMGYLWATGFSGTGKTRLIVAVSAAAHLGYVVEMSSTLPTLRDLAEAGATLGIDEAETVMNPKLIEADKRALLLSGNRRPSFISLKEPTPGGAWRTRHVDVYSPRLFAAINPPDGVLASRAIIVPLFKSEGHTLGDPGKLETWPVGLGELVDDLWAMALVALPSISDHVAAASARASLKGRAGEPWLGPLAVASWLDAEVPRLFSRLDKLSAAIQEDREEDVEFDPKRFVLQGLWELVRDDEDSYDVCEVSGVSDGSVGEYPTSGMLEVIQGVFASHAMTTALNERSLGKFMRRLGFKKVPATATGKRWYLSKREVARVYRAWFGSGIVTPHTHTNGMNDKNVKTSSVTLVAAEHFPRAIQTEVENGVPAEVVS